MGTVADQIAQLEAAVAAQEALRPTLGDAVVAAAVDALRARIATLEAERSRPASGDPAKPRPTATATNGLEELRSRIPSALADKARILGAAARRETERRTVTVVFADLSGFTALNERLDAETVRAFQGDLFDEMSDVVYDHEGFVEKFVGDAIMAIFGAPLSHEDDPERALRASLALRERMDGLNERWHERLGEALTLHIGIDTGMVVAGQMGSDTGTYAVTGDTITTASRLQTAAAPGQILVSEKTYRVAHEAFTFRPLDPVTVKGKRQPLPVFELVRARLHPGKSRGLQGLESTIVGRGAELARLRDVTADLLEGRGGIAMLTGDAGIGKSRLIRELQATVDRKVRWLEGRCYAGNSALPYGPFLDMCRRHAGITEDDTDAHARARLRHLLQRVLPDDADAVPLVAGMLGMRLEPDETDLLRALTPQALEQRLLDLIERFFTRLAHGRPTVLVIEDLHWADSSSLDLLERLMALTETLPLAILGATRPTPEGASPVRELLARSPGHVTEVVVAPLGQAATADLIRGLLSMSQLPAAARDLIVSRCEGNPFYVEEVIRSLIDRGAIVRSGDSEHWVATALLDRASVPDTLHGVLMSRLDQLPDETKRVAQHAAVIGRVFARRVLQRLAGSETLDADLGHLEQEAVIRELRGGEEHEYAFRHALIQEVAYESLVAPARRSLHAQVGEAIEEVHRDRLGELSGVLGTHFLRGEQWDKAFKYLRKAGDAATRLHAHPEAREHYVHALEALAAMPPDDVVRRHVINTTIKLVTVSWGADDPGLNLARLEHATTVAGELAGASRKRAADRARLARVHYWMGVLHYLRDEPIEAIGYFQQVLAVGQELGDEELLAMPSALIGRAMIMQGRFAEAAGLLARALDPLARAGDWLEWSYTLAFHGAALAIQGQLDEGRRESERALARARETGNQTAIAGCQLAMSFFPFLARDPHALRDAGRTAAEAGEAAGSPLLVHIAICFEAWAWSWLGEHEAARRRMADAQAVADALGGRLFMADWVAAAHAELALNAGRPDEAIERAAAALEMARAVEGIFGEALALRALGLALAAVEPPSHDRSDEHLARSIELFEAGGCVVEAAHSRVAWAELWMARGEEARAGRLLEAAVAALDAAGFRGPADRARVLLEACHAREAR